MPAKASIVVTDIAIPNKPAIWLVYKIPDTIINAGNAVAYKETAKPWITFVPWPVVDDLAILKTGRNLVPV